MNWSNLIILWGESDIKLTVQGTEIIPLVEFLAVEPSDENYSGSESALHAKAVLV